MENNEVIIPKGYKLYEVEGHSMMGNKKEEFNIKNRSFQDIDGYFSNEISKKINELLLNNSNNQVFVLDLAGGTESRAVNEIEKEFGNRMKAINIDIAINPNKGIETNRIQGDATQIPLANSSMDIVYSRQFLPFIMRFNPEHFSQLKKVITEIARVLKPGGIAFLDDEEELSGVRSESKRREIAAELGVILEPHESINNKKGNMNFPKFWNREVIPEKYLLMKKP